MRKLLWIAWKLALLACWVAIMVIGVVKIMLALAVGFIAGVSNDDW